MTSAENVSSDVSAQDGSAHTRRSALELHQEQLARDIGELVLAALTVLAAVVVLLAADGHPESETAIVGIAGTAVGAVLRGRMSR